MERYIGLDVHASSCTAAIIDGRGKHVGSQVIETNGKALVEFFKIQPGNVHLCLEEGTQATWLAEILRPHVAELVVTIPPKSRGQKNDELDAFARAEALRRGAVDVRVYKEVGSFGTLRQMVKTHVALVDDTRRVKNRLKMLYQARGIPTPGTGVYGKTGRDEWLSQLPKSSRTSAVILYSQYDALSELKDAAEKEMIRESHRHPITRKLETCPGMGPIRVARFVSVVVSPHRIRGRRQLWSYSGLAVVMRTSSDWEQMPDRSWERMRKPQTRGLNWNFNRMLKDVFKGAASTVIERGGDEPLYQEYLRQLEGGTKPTLARLTLARKIAAVSLSMWKREEGYDAKRRLGSLT
jgi:transposase